MDAIDNLIYSAQNTCIYPPNGVVSNPVTGREAIGATTPRPDVFNNGNASYVTQTRYNFVSLDDPYVIENTIRKHWFDIANRISYTNMDGVVDPTGDTFRNFHPNNAVTNPNGPRNEQAYIKFNTPPYHLIFSYLVENTRIAQIFEKLIWMYVHDEKLTKAGPDAFRWITNTEALFYKDASPSDRRSQTSQLRPVSEATRRNAYFRMFGMDLAFGDINNNTYQYTKAETNNSTFITMLERFLVEVWKGYINANNTSGQNTTDTEHLEDLSRRLQEMLMNRRTTELNFTNYRYYNLSAEEYSSYIFMYWLFFIISYNSPVVDFLNCTGNTAGDRLMNIGRRIGLPAHTKSVAILDIAQPMNAILRSFELGLFNNADVLRRIIRSHSTVNPINPLPTPQEIEIMNNLLLIINNWERATGHRIKNPEANITGTLRVQQTGGNGKLVQALT